MALIRFTVDLAIPENTYNLISAATKAEFRDRVRRLKSYAVKINEGTPSEEATVQAKWHTCRHDEGMPCGEAQDI